MDGKEAEIQAIKYLQKQKLSLVKSNFNCRFGEIDIIMQDRQTLVFVEVRLRKNQHFGGAAASVTRQKQSKIIKTAQFFLAKHTQYQHKNCRFDVIAYEYDSAPDKPVWYKGAFTI